MACGTPSPRASGALLSCLGFPGWGGLHLIVPDRGDPPGLARRLQLSEGETAAGDSETTCGDLPAGLLLPALLRRHRDLEPLDPDRWPWAREAPAVWPDRWRHRYLLVCRWGAARPLRISGWHLQEDTGGWVRSCGPMALAVFRHQFLAASDAAQPRRRPPSGLRR